MKNGPLENRSCTDILCCLIFIVFLVAMGACVAYGYSNGDPLKLGYAYDAEGNGCGSSATSNSTYGSLSYADYKYMYFPAPTATTARRYMCVKKCYSETDFTGTASIEYIPNRRVISGALAT